MQDVSKNYLALFPYLEISNSHVIIFKFTEFLK